MAEERNEQGTERPRPRRTSLRDHMTADSTAAGLGSVALEFVRRPEIYPQFIQWMKDTAPEMKDGEMDLLAEHTTPEVLERADMHLAMRASTLGDLRELFR